MTIKWSIEFWSEDCENEFNDLYDKMCKKGFLPTEAQKLLESIYHTVAAEYGD